MTPHRLSSRRSLLTAAAAFCAAIIGRGGWRRAAWGSRAPSTQQLRALAMLCDELRCPATIGSACLHRLPNAERSGAGLASSILVELASAGRDCGSTVALRTSIGEQNRMDFANGRIVDVDGWILSRTETRLYALSAVPNWL